MNTYYVSRKAVYNEYFEVETASEELAKEAVEYGNEAPVDRQLDYAENTRINDIEYGDVPWNCTVEVVVHACGPAAGDNLEGAIKELIEGLTNATLAKHETTFEVAYTEVMEIEQGDF